MNNSNTRFRTLAISMLTAAAASFSQTSEVWMRLFDGATLTGWKGRPGNWKVENGALVGGFGASSNTFLITDSSYGDFHLKWEARIPGSGGYRNSGIVYRTEWMNDYFTLKGYQYEISDGAIGGFYHERGDPMELPWTPSVGCSEGGVSNWVAMEIIADGPKLTHIVKGKTCFERTDMKITKKGVIGLQIHSPGDVRSEFRNLYIKPLNNSFQIPAGKGFDADGNPVTTVRAFTPRNTGASAQPGRDVARAGYDLKGRRLQAPHPKGQARL